MSNLTKNKYISIFDIGHGAIRLAILSPDRNSVAVYSRPTKGFVKGKVQNLRELSTCISELAADAGLSKISARTIVVIPSLHTRYKVQTLNYRTSGVYRSNDFSALVDAATDSAGGDLDEAIDSIFLSFKIDQNQVNPLSFTASGRDIIAEIKVALHPKVILADIVAAMNMAGVEVSEFRASGFGLAHALLTLKPNALNTVLIDFGHSSTTGVLQVGGSIHTIFTVAAGSDHVTRDLVAGAALDYLEAESTKLALGVVADESAAPQDLSSVHRVIQPRVLEIFRLAMRHFAIYARSLDGGLLLAGGGSKFAGLSSFITKSLGLSQVFVCSLAKSSAESLTGVAVTWNCDKAVIDAGWLSLFALVRVILDEEKSRMFERTSRPMSRLRPLWTWLSELSR